MRSAAKYTLVRTASTECEELTALHAVKSSRVANVAARAELSAKCRSADPARIQRHARVQCLDTPDSPALQQPADREATHLEQRGTGKPGS